MKKHNTLILCSLTSLFLLACGESQDESSAKAIENPVDTYLDSRVSAMDMAKESVKESNKRVDEQNKAMEALIKGN